MVLLHTRLHLVKKHFLHSTVGRVVWIPTVVEFNHAILFNWFCRPLVTVRYKFSFVFLQPGSLGLATCLRNLLASVQLIQSRRDHWRHFCCFHDVVHVRTHFLNVFFTGQLLDESPMPRRTPSLFAPSLVQPERTQQR